MSDQPTEPTQSEVNLQLTDLVAALEIFQLASNRGAFKPEEFTTVGGVYERLYAFLESTGAVQRTQPQTNQQGDQE
ncbi:MAG: hypothetical protein EBU08_09670 [Micrococcales bacterium]|jgi:hypothetical protein|nr:hypothetical protein [Micrococcales bacterium]